MANRLKYNKSDIIGRLNNADVISDALENPTGIFVNSSKKKASLLEDNAKKIIKVKKDTSEIKKTLDKSLKRLKAKLNG